MPPTCRALAMIQAWPATSRFSRPIRIGSSRSCGWPRHAAPSCARVPSCTARSAEDGSSLNMEKLKRKQFEKELMRLQGKLCILQEYVKAKGLRVIIVFEGRDAAGKGGTIKAITERVSPRVFRVIALPAPTDREKSQMYLQRFFQHFPAAGEV